MTHAGPTGGASRPTFAGRRLAEAVRVIERDGDRPRPSGPIAPGGDFEARVVARAAATPGAADLRATIDQVVGGTRMAFAGLLVLFAVLGGLAAAAAARGLPAEPTDGAAWRTIGLIETLGTLLIVQTLLLLAWAVLTLFVRRRLATSPLLLVPRAMLRRVAGWGRRVRPSRGPGPNPVSDAASGGLDRATRLSAAAAAVATPFGDRRIGRATAGVLAHGAWTAFNLGAIVVLVGLFVGRGYRFTWETTLLRPEAAERVVRAFAAGPEAAGLVPRLDAVIARVDGTDLATQSDADRRALARLVLAGVVLYGLAPRAALLLLYAGFRVRARRLWRLDLDRPGFARLRSELMPAAHAAPADSQPGTLPRTEPPAPEPEEADPSGEGIDPAAPVGPPAVARLEWEPSGPWPPDLGGTGWLDLGSLDARADRRRALSTLDAAAAAPRRIVVVVDLAVTPDRGHEHLLTTLRGSGPRPVRLVLAGGHALHRRGGAAAVRDRVAVWRMAAARVGLGPERVLECDLDHATAASLDALAAFLGIERPGAASRATGTGPASHLDSALDLVVEAVVTWRHPPDALAQAELHRAIQRRYRAVPAMIVPAATGGAGEAADVADAAVRDGLAAGARSESLSGARDLLGPAAGRLRGLAEAGDVEARIAGVRRAAAAFSGELPERLRSSSRWAAAGALAGACGCVAAAAAVSPLAIAALPAWSGIGAAVAGIVAATRERTGGDAASSEAGDPNAGDGGPSGSDPATADAVDAAITTILVLELQGRPEFTVADVLERTLVDLPRPRAVPGDRAGIRSHVDRVRERFDTAMADHARVAGAGSGGGRAGEARA